MKVERIQIHVEKIPFQCWVELDGQRLEQVERIQFDCDASRLYEPTRVVITLANVVIDVDGIGSTELQRHDIHVQQMGRPHA